MLVLLLVLVIVCSCVQDSLNRSVARRLSRESGRTFDECLAAVKGTTVARLRANRRASVFCVLIAVVVTALLYGCRA